MCDHGSVCESSPSICTFASGWCRVFVSWRILCACIITLHVCAVVAQCRPPVGTCPACSCLLGCCAVYWPQLTLDQLISSAKTGGQEASNCSVDWLTISKHILLKCAFSPFSTLWHVFPPLLSLSPSPCLLINRLLIRFYTNPRHLIEKQRCLPCLFYLTAWTNLM